MSAFRGGADAGDDALRVDDEEQEGKILRPRMEVNCEYRSRFWAQDR